MAPLCRLWCVNETVHSADMVKSTRTNYVWEDTDDTLLCGTIRLGLSPVALAVLRGQGAGGTSCASRGRKDFGVCAVGAAVPARVVWEMGGGDGARALGLAAALPTHWGLAGGCTAGSRQKRRIARFC